MAAEVTAAAAARYSFQSRMFQSRGDRLLALRWKCDVNRFSRFGKLKAPQEARLGLSNLAALDAAARCFLFLGGLFTGGFARLFGETQRA